MTSQFQLPCIALLSLFVAACTNYRSGGSEPAPVETSPYYTTAKPAPAASEPNTVEVAAYQSLLDKAEQARGIGDYEQALALLERAQRIDADSADIYLALAHTHRERGDPAQARAVAERGLLYCDADSQCDALRAYTH